MTKEELKKYGLDRNEESLIPCNIINIEKFRSKPFVNMEPDKMRITIDIDMKYWQRLRKILDPILHLQKDG